MRKAATSLTMTLAITLIAASDAPAEIAWQNNLRAAHAQAQSEGKLLLLHFYSDNCKYCEKLEQGAFQEPQVGKTISQGFIPVKVHANKSPKLAEMFKVKKFPTDVIVTTSGKTLSHSVSPQSADRYVSMLRSSSATLADASPAAPVTSVVASTPVPETRLAQDSAAAEVPASSGQTSSYPLPGYATSAAPTTTVSAPIASPVASSDPSDATLAIPQNGLSGGATSQLAGSRGMSLQMPSIDSAPQDTEQAAEQVTEQLAERVDASSALEIEPVPAAAITANVSDSPAISIEPAILAASGQQPELAMQGFCPVSVIQDDKWIEGKPEFGVIHLGKLYLFTSQEKMQTFLSDPVPYTPVLNEIDAVIFFEERRIVPGKREWGLKDPVYNRMFFFADEASMNHFYNSYERYTKAAIEVMEKAVTDANPGS